MQGWILKSAWFPNKWFYNKVFYNMSCYCLFKNYYGNDKFTVSLKVGHIYVWKFCFILTVGNTIFDISTSEQYWYRIWIIVIKMLGSAWRSSRDKAKFTIMGAAVFWHATLTFPASVWLMVPAEWPRKAQPSAKLMNARNMLHTFSYEITHAPQSRNRT